MENQKNKLKLSNAPTRKELLELYSDYGVSIVDLAIKEVVHELPSYINSGKKRIRKISNGQFILFIKKMGLPKGFKQQEIPFLSGIKIL